jgi:hypothetical protein
LTLLSQIWLRSFRQFNFGKALVNTWLWNVFMISSRKIHGGLTRSSDFPFDFMALATNPGFMASMGHRKAALLDSRLLPMLESENGSLP